MRHIFIVFAKLIGLLQIYWGLTYLSSIALFVGQMARIEPSHWGSVAIQTGGILGFALLAFGMAWVLLTRTEWLADKLNIRYTADILKEEAEKTESAPTQVLQ